MPGFDVMYVVALLSRLAHILSAVVLVGGIVYLRSIVASDTGGAAEDTDVDAAAKRYFGSLRGRWAMIVAACTAFLIVSGFYNFLIKVLAEKYSPVYHALFGVKFSLAMVVFFCAAIVAGKTDSATRARQKMKQWLNTAIVCAVVLIVIASVMRTFEGTSKDDANATLDQQSTTDIFNT